MTIRTYTELSELNTFIDRFKYLRLNGAVGEKTFGSERQLNQKFYSSREWKLIRDEVITRDAGLDLGFIGFEIYDRVLIHHMNPVTIDDIRHGNSDILAPEYLISTTHNTHNAIHYGDESLLRLPIQERRPGDTALWKPKLQRSMT